MITANTTALLTQPSLSPYPLPLPGVQLVLACDAQISENFPPFHEEVSTCDQEDIPATHMGLDIGPKVPLPHIIDKCLLYLLQSM